MHGREHRAFNDRLDELGYPVKRVERFTKWGLGDPRAVPAADVEPGRHRRPRALHRHLAELLLPDEEARDCSATRASRDLFLWHALEESEHKAVAFDVYKAVGGTERIRVLDDELHHRRLHRRHGRPGHRLAAARPRHLPQGRAPQQLEAAAGARPFLSAASCWRQLRDYNRPDFHPDDHDTTELVAEWRERAVRRPRARSNDKLRRRTAQPPDRRHGRTDVRAPRRPRRRRRPVGHRRRPPPPDRVPVGDLRRSSRRATPSAARGTCSATPASAPTPTCSPSATRSGRGQARDHRRRRLDPAVHPATPPREDGHRRADPLPPPDRRRRVVDRRRPLDVTAERTDTGETRRAHVPASCSRAAATTATTTATSPTSRAWTASGARSSTPRPGPRTSTTPASGSWSIGSGATAVTLDPVAGRDRRRTSRCCSARPPTSPRCRPRNPLAALLRRVLPDRSPAAPSGGCNALGTQAFYQLSQRRPGAGEEGAAASGVERQLPEGYDIDTHFTPRYDPWDQRLCVVPDGDLFKAIRAGTASVVTDHIDTFTETGIRLRVGRRARGRHHRHRHRARAAVHRRHRADGRRRAGRHLPSGSPTRG